MLRRPRTDRRPNPLSWPGVGDHLPAAQAPPLLGGCRHDRGRLLDYEGLRREIHEGLNVTENWNSATGFISYGKGWEIATNRHDEQEAAALHLLQASLVYVNTLMLQQILAEPGWFGRMTPEDLRALSPLIYHHINPYGTFELDLSKRLRLAAA
jgi:hypothetical protein